MPSNTEPPHSRGDDEIFKHIQNIGKITGYGEQLFDDAWKWYDHEEHMLEYSKYYPGTVFKLDGEGEEASDIWVKWFKNGHMQVWRLEYKIPSDPRKEWP